MGARGPKPLPANVHQLRGNPSKKSVADLFDGVQPPVVIPRCPPHLQDEARKEWRRIGSELEALGLVSQIDRGALSAYCTAWAEMVHCDRKIDELNAADPDGQAGYVMDTPSGYKQMSVWVQIRNRAADRMMKFGSEFGMSPSARRGVTKSDNRQQHLFDEPKGTAWDSL